MHVTQLEPNFLPLCGSCVTSALSTEWGFIFIYMCVYIYICVCLYKNPHIYTYIYTHMCVYIKVCIYTHTHISIYIHTHIYIYILILDIIISVDAIVIIEVSNIPLNNTNCNACVISSHPNTTLFVSQLGHDESLDQSRCFKFDVGSFRFDAVVAEASGFGPGCFRWRRCSNESQLSLQTQIGSSPVPTWCPNAA